MIFWWLFPGSDCKALNLPGSFVSPQRWLIYFSLWSPWRTWRCKAEMSFSVNLWVKTRPPPNRNVRANRARPGTLIQTILHQVGIARPGPRPSLPLFRAWKGNDFPLHLSQCCCANWKLKAWIHSKGATFSFSQNLSDHSGGWTSLQKLNQDVSQRTLGAGGSFVTLFHL